MCVVAEKIVLKIREAGFSVVAQKDTQLTKELAEELYDTCKTQEYYGDLTQYMTRSAIEHSAAGHQQLITPAITINHIACITCVKYCNVSSVHWGK